MDGTQLAVATAGGVALVMSTSVPALLAFFQGRKTRRIVQGNGQGDVSVMMERGAGAHR